ncbi:cilia- and flagella-associated protein 251-like isoform X1 [Xenopus laevis]|uniref:Cilia- and flagella-associated protein 251-like isoform X1 n=1 Tax=Xenopus laevis TaxID=8355 RepID=A0A8J1MIS1_XENLA|nr:cilia- and flagella-associated protein 251-like isoform X1 [Xenopus laevis]
MERSIEMESVLLTWKNFREEEETDIESLLYFYEHHYRREFGKIDDLANFLIRYAATHQYLTRANLVYFIYVVMNLEQLDNIVADFQLPESPLRDINMDPEEVAEALKVSVRITVSVPHPSSNTEYKCLIYPLLLSLCLPRQALRSISEGMERKLLEKEKELEEAAMTSQQEKVEEDHLQEEETNREEQEEVEHHLEEREKQKKEPDEDVPAEKKEDVEDLEKDDPPEQQEEGIELEEQEEQMQEQEEDVPAEKKEEAEEPAKDDPAEKKEEEVEELERGVPAEKKEDVEDMEKDDPSEQQEEGIELEEQEEQMQEQEEDVPAEKKEEAEEPAKDDLAERKKKRWKNWREVFLPKRKRM